MRPHPSTDRPEKVMSFGEHLDELRKRLLYAIYGLAPIVVVAMIFGDTFMAVLTRPAERMLGGEGQHLFINTGLLEPFNAYFYVCIIFAVLVGAPWVLYQLWLFIAPGLYLKERRFVHILAPMSITLAMLSAVFTYYVMLPAILEFFDAWNATIKAQPVATLPLPDGVALPSLPVLAADPVNPPAGAMWFNSTINEMRVCMSPGTSGHSAVIRGTGLHGDSLIEQKLRISQYVDMVFNFALAFAAGFQMPVVVLLLGWVGIVKVEFLKKYRKHALFTCAVLGGVLTPGDPLSASLLAVPLYILFEFGLLMLQWLPASKVRGEKPQAEAPVEAA